MAEQLQLVQTPPSIIIDAPRSQSDTPHTMGLLWTSDQPEARPLPDKHTALTRERRPCHRWDSNTQSQQADRSRATPLDRAAVQIDWHTQIYTERHGGRRDGSWNCRVKLLVILLAFV